MFYPASEQDAILGRLLLDILHGHVSDETVFLVDQIDRKEVPGYLNNLVGYVQGMNMASEVRESICRDLLDELRLTADEQLLKLWPPPPNLLPALWDTAALVPDRVKPALKALLLDTVLGEIRSGTWVAIIGLGELDDVPEPFQNYLTYAQTHAGAGKDLAKDLLINLRIDAWLQLKKVHWD
jgi:hypothetical protein